MKQSVPWRCCIWQYVPSNYNRQDPIAELPKISGKCALVILLCRGWIIFAGGDGTGAAKEKRNQEGKEKLSLYAAGTKEQLVPGPEIDETFAAGVKRLRSEGRQACVSNETKKGRGIVPWP